MDPILEEMRRAKDVRDGSIQKWTDYLVVLVAAKDDTIATLRTEIATLQAQLAVYRERRGPGRPSAADVARRDEVLNG
jgi:uncharacterized small protein (DUF1192 family)